MTQVVNCSRDEYDVYIGRPSIYGNPFRLRKESERQEVLDAYRLYLANCPDIVDRARKELTGKRLGCYCKPKACHGDILIEFMERSE